MASRNQVDTPLSGSSGTGSFVGSTSATLTSPTLITPALGTPASGVLSNCTNFSWGSQSGTGINIQFATGTITAGQMVLLNASPVTIIAAPGVGKLICVTSVISHFLYTAPAYTAAAAQQIRLKFANTTTLFANFCTNTMMVGTANAVSEGPTNQNATITETNSLNNAVVAQNIIATEISGGNGTIKYYIRYFIVDTTI